MKKMLIICLVVLSLFIVACSSLKTMDKNKIPASGGGAAASGSVQQVDSGVSDVDMLNNELNSSDADKAAGELEKLNW